MTVDKIKYFISYLYSIADYHILLLCNTYLFICFTFFVVHLVDKRGLKKTYLFIFVEVFKYSEFKYFKPRRI